MSSHDPMLVLAITGPDGKVTDSPLFAAVRVTASLCRRLRTLANVANKHGVDIMSLRHLDAPIYWDFPPDSTLDSCMEEHCQWRMAQSTIFLELWGRLQMHEGEFSETQLLAVATMIDIEILEHLRASKYQIDYLEDEGTAAMLGQPFALAVHERFVALSKLRRPKPTG
jgi:hypothetical protein